MVTKLIIQVQNPPVPLKCLIEESMCEDSSGLNEVLNRRVSGFLYLRESVVRGEVG